jgi:CHASE1-domain containing sensor protein
MAGFLALVLLLVGLAEWHISTRCQRQRQTKFEAKAIVVLASPG